MRNELFLPLHCFGKICHSNRMKLEQCPRLWNPPQGYTCKAVADFYIIEHNSSISDCIDRLMNPGRFGYYSPAPVLDICKISLQFLNHIGFLEI